MMTRWSEDGGADTVIDAETILVRLRDSDVEIEQTVC